jgi:hypothetical protein
LCIGSFYVQIDAKTLAKWRIWPNNLKGVLKIDKQVWMFMVFTPYDLVMAILMERGTCTQHNLEDWCPHTLQTMFKGILQLFRVNMTFLLLHVLELVCLWRLYIDHGAKCYHPNISHKLGHVWCKMPSLMNSQAFKLSHIYRLNDYMSIFRR